LWKTGQLGRSENGQYWQGDQGRYQSRKDQKLKLAGVQEMHNTDSNNGIHVKAVKCKN